MEGGLERAGDVLGAVGVLGVVDVLGAEDGARNSASLSAPVRERGTAPEAAVAIPSLDVLENATQLQ